MSTFHITLTGIEAALRRILGVHERFERPQPAFRSIADFLRGAERSAFESGGHGRWRELQANTLRQKARRNQPAAVLRATDALMQSLTRKGAAGSRETISAHELLFGTEVFYARFQARSGRAPIALTDADHREVPKRLARYMLTGEL